jgi:hypothetical protein
LAFGNRSTPAIFVTDAGLQSLADADARTLDELLAQSLRSLDIADPPRPLTSEEVYRLSALMFDELQTWWVATQREDLARFGRSMGLFDPLTAPANLRHKFVVFDGSELQFFDTESAAADAAEVVMRRNVGPIKAAYYSATDSALPVPHVGIVAEEDIPLDRCQWWHCGATGSDATSHEPFRRRPVADLVWLTFTTSFRRYRFVPNSTPMCMPVQCRLSLRVSLSMILVPLMHSTQLLIAVKHMHLFRGLQARCGPTLIILSQQYLS